MNQNLESKCFLWLFGFSQYIGTPSLSNTAIRIVLYNGAEGGESHFLKIDFTSIVKSFKNVY